MQAKQVLFHDGTATLPMEGKDAEDRVMMSTPEYGFIEKQSWAIFDGHGGSEVSQLLSEQFPIFLKEAMSEQTSLRQALITAFARADESVCEFIKQGSTALVTLLTPDSIYFANVGLSRAVIYEVEVEGEDTVPHFYITSPHTPDNKHEKARIEAAGGEITFLQNAWRVGNRLSTSRTLGSQPREAGLISIPTINQIPLKPSYRFIIIASSGVWHVMSAEEAISIVKRALNMASPPAAARSLIKEAREKGAKKELTAIVIRLSEAYY